MTTRLALTGWRQLPGTCPESSKAALGAVADGFEAHTPWVGARWLRQAPWQGQHQLRRGDQRPVVGTRSARRQQFFVLCECTKLTVAQGM